MTIRPIENEADLREALAQVEALWEEKDESTQAADDLKVLSILIEDYERRTSPIAPPTPIEAIRFRMDQMGINTARLGEFMGTTRSRASEVLNGKRSLTLPMIRSLVHTLGISADVLISGERHSVPPSESAHP